MSGEVVYIKCPYLNVNIVSLTLVTFTEITKLPVTQTGMLKIGVLADLWLESAPISSVPAWENHLMVGICDICWRLPILDCLSRDSVSNQGLLFNDGF